MNSKSGIKDPQSLVGRIALVSGSSQGIGKGIALALANAGSVVYVNGRDETKVAATVHEIQSHGGKAHSLVADMSQEETIHQSIERVVAEQGGLDLVIANLGGGRVTRGWDITMNEARRVFDLNFFSSVALAHFALPYLRKSVVGGQLVFISSIAGCEAIGAPILYSAAKASLLAYAKNLANFVATDGVRVNAISPGNTFFPGSTWDDKMQKDEVGVREYLRQNVPLNGFASPEDIARAVVFLAQSPFITGHNLIVDGGQTHKII